MDRHQRIRHEHVALAHDGLSLADKCATSRCPDCRMSSAVLRALSTALLSWTRDRDTLRVPPNPGRAPVVGNWKELQAEERKQAQRDQDPTVSGRAPVSNSVLRPPPIPRPTIEDAVMAPADRDVLGDAFDLEAEANELQPTADVNTADLIEEHYVRSEDEDER